MTSPLEFLMEELTSDNPQQVRARALAPAWRQLRAASVSGPNKAGVKRRCHSSGDNKQLTRIKTRKAVVEERMI